MKTLLVTEEELNKLVINSLSQGHTMEEVHSLLNEINVVLVKGGK